MPILESVPIKRGTWKRKWVISPPKLKPTTYLDETIDIFHLCKLRLKVDFSGHATFLTTLTPSSEDSDKIFCLSMKNSFMFFNRFALQHTYKCLHIFHSYLFSNSGHFTVEQDNLKLLSGLNTFYDIDWANYKKLIYPQHHPTHSPKQIYITNWIY